jgi:hypothetical protein
MNRIGSLRLPHADYLTLSASDLALQLCFAMHFQILCNLVTPIAFWMFQVVFIYVRFLDLRLNQLLLRSILQIQFRRGGRLMYSGFNLTLVTISTSSESEPILSSLIFLSSTSLCLRMIQRLVNWRYNR